jgi:ferrous iron transport protein A
MAISLADMKVGTRARIVQIDGGLAIRARLSSLNIRIGKAVRKVASQPFRGPVVIEVDGRRLSLGRGMAVKIFVEVLK